MATVLAVGSLGTPKRITCSATPGNLEKVTLPHWCARVRIQAIGGAGKVATTGTDAAAIGADYWTLPSNVGEEHEYPAGSDIYIAHTVISGVVEIIPLGLSPK